MTNNFKPVEQPIESVWDFVTAFFPNYYHSDKIAYNDDLHKIMDNEIDEGSAAERIFQEDFSGSMVAAGIAKDASDAEIFAEAIEGYIAAQKHCGSMPVMPNGFASWREIHYMICEGITEALNQEEDKIPPLLQNIDGFGGRWELAEHLTNKFEENHKGTEWDGNFFDEIQSFIEVEFQIKR